MVVVNNIVIMNSIVNRILVLLEQERSVALLPLGAAAAPPAALYAWHGWDCDLLRTMTNGRKMVILQHTVG